MNVHSYSVTYVSLFSIFPIAISCVRFLLCLAKSFIPKCAKHFLWTLNAPPVPHLLLLFVSIKLLFETVEKTSEENFSTPPLYNLWMCEGKFYWWSRIIWSTHTVFVTEVNAVFISKFTNRTHTHTIPLRWFFVVVNFSSYFHFTKFKSPCNQSYQSMNHKTLHSKAHATNKNRRQ